MKCGTTHVGYRGQKYKVMANKISDGTLVPLGWQNDENLSAWEPLCAAWRLRDLRLEEVQADPSRLGEK